MAEKVEIRSDIVTRAEIGERLRTMDHRGSWLTSALVGLQISPGEEAAATAVGTVIYLMPIAYSTVLKELVLQFNVATTKESYNIGVYGIDPFRQNEYVLIKEDIIGTAPSGEAGIKKDILTSDNWNKTIYQRLIDSDTNRPIDAFKPFSKHKTGVLALTVKTAISAHATDVTKLDARISYVEMSGSDAPLRESSIRHRGGAIL